MPLLTYRTGPFAGSGIPIANGMDDYLRMLNERDGGIGGVKLRSRNARPATTPRRASSATSRSRARTRSSSIPYSTGITLQLIPKAAVDKIPILSMAYGLSASAVGNVLPVGVQPAGDLLGRRCPLFIKHIGGKEGGLDKLKGKKIGCIYLDAPLRQGADPAARAARQGLRLRAEALSGRRPPTCRTSGSQWLNIRRDRPDWIYM